MGQFQRLVHDGFKVASVIGLGHGIFVRHLARLDHVGASELQAVNATHSSGLVHEALDVEDRLWTTGSTVGAGRCSVGHHSREVVVNEANVIHPGLNPRTDEELNGHPSHARIGAHIGLGVDLERHDFALGVQRHADVTHDIAPMRAGQKVLRALGLPFDGTLQLVSAKRHHQVFWIGARLHAKASTHIAHDHPDVAGGDAKEVGNLSVRCTGHL